MPRFLAVLIVALVSVGSVVVTAASARPTTAITGFSFSPSRFAVPTSATAGAAQGRVTTMRFRLSSRATVRIAFARKAAGRRSAGRCVKAMPRLRDRRTCTRYRRVGKLVRSGLKAGRVALPFSGRLRGKALKPGTYRATIIAVRRRHRRSRAERARFVVVAARHNQQPPPGSQQPSPSPPPTGAQFPNPSTVGVPAGWAPGQIRSSNLTVATAGAVVQDVLLSNGADLYIAAPNVTVRRVKLEGGSINNLVNRSCGNGLVLEDVTIERGSGESSQGGEGVVSYGGYTARRVAILDRSEGFRSGANGSCGPSTIEDSFIGIRPPAACGDWHGDGIQGYISGGLTIRNVTIDFHQDNCGGTAGFFYPGGPDGSPNARADINRLLLKGGPYPFRMGTPGSVQALKIVNNSWGYGPSLITDTGCGAINPWEASIVDITPDYQIARTVRSLPCR